MADLTGQTVSSTYTTLLKVETSPINTVYNVVESGLGVDSALMLSTLGVKSSGLLESVGNTTIGGTLGVTGVSTLASAVVTGSATVGTTLGVTGVLTATGGVVGALTGAVTGNTAGVHTGAVTGNVTGNATGSSGSCTGNSATATALATARNIQVSGDVTGTASFDGSANINIAATLAAQPVPAGSVFNFAASTAPTGYLECSGAAVSRTTYAALFAVTSTTFGVGDGSTTFNLPNLRGEFVRGFDNGRGVDASRAFGSAQSDELKAHTHTTTFPNSDDPSNGTRHVTGSNADSADEVFTSSSTGGAETRPRNIALLYCIKT